MTALRLSAVDSIQLHGISIYRKLILSLRLQQAINLAHRFSVETAQYPDESMADLVCAPCTYWSRTPSVGDAPKHILRSYQLCNL